MLKARAFFYVCAGLFLLALSYHFGAQSAGAQVGSMVSGFTVNGSMTRYCEGTFYVMTDNGDVYGRNMAGGACGSGGPLAYIGNFWSGSGPTPTEQESWGAVKSRYRGERAVQPAPVGR